MLFGSLNLSNGTFMEHLAVVSAKSGERALRFLHFLPERFFDMVGVTGSIPVAPTI